MKENRIPNIRFAPEVPDKECEKCKFTTYGHPLLKSINSEPNCEGYNKLCIKDCLKFKIPMDLDNITKCYQLKNPDCIQDSMTRCDCVAKTPKGISYHPALKAVYERRGAKGEFVKVGLRCPKCGKYYNLEGDRK